MKKENLDRLAHDIKEYVKGEMSTGNYEEYVRDNQEDGVTVLSFQEWLMEYDLCAGTYSFEDWVDLGFSDMRADLDPMEYGLEECEGDSWYEEMTDEERDHINKKVEELF